MAEEQELPWIPGFWRRIGALFLDTGFLAFVGFVLGVFLEDLFIQLGAWGPFVGFALGLVYFGIGNSALTGGQTIGKRIFRLRVVDAANAPIGIGRSLLRYVIFATPFSLNGAHFTEEAMFSDLVYPLSLLVFGGSFSIVYLYVFNRVTRQSLHDLVVGTYVVNSEAVQQDVAGVWKVHIAVVVVLFLLAGIAPVFTASLSEEEPFRNLVAVQMALDNQPGVDYVSVSVGTTSNKGRESKSYVSSEVYLTARRIEDRELARRLALIVMDNYPDAKNKDIIQIVLSYGYDIGVWSQLFNQAHEFSPDELQGDADAQNALGLMYASGEGVAEDDAEAVRWYRKAADQGHPGAQTNLGAMYANGTGVAEDDAEAVRWYRKAADQGYTGAQNNLLNNIAWILVTTDDPRLRDPQEGLRLAQQSVEASSGQKASSLDTLGEAYYVNGRFDEAIEVVKKAIALQPQDVLILLHLQKQLYKFEQARLAAAAASGSKADNDEHPSCDFSDSRTVDFRHEGSADIFETTLVGEPCHDATLSWVLRDREGQVLDRSEGRLPDHVVDQLHSMIGIDVRRHSARSLVYGPYQSAFENCTPRFARELPADEAEMSRLNNDKAAGAIWDMLVEATKYRELLGASGRVMCAGLYEGLEYWVFDPATGKRIALASLAW